MEQIIIDLNNPAWWFRGVFFIFAAIFLNKLFFSWFPAWWRMAYAFMPKIAKRVVRHEKRRVLLVVKRYRQHEVLVTHLISRYWALATVFSIFLFLGFVFLIPTQMTIFSFWPKEAALFPVISYLLLFLVVREKRILKRTIKAHIQWKKGLTHHSTGPPTCRRSPFNRRAWRPVNSNVRPYMDAPRLPSSQFMSA